MGRKQSERAVHDLRSLTLQAGELPKPRLDPIERRQNVEPRHDVVAFFKARRCCCLRQPRALPMLGKSCGQGALRLRRVPKDDDRADLASRRGHQAATLSRRSILSSTLATAITRVQQPLLSLA
jgi:hypothetical protein